MKKGVIYSVINIENGKRYIGQTVNYKRRIKEHRRKLIKNKHENDHLQRAWNKYGRNNFKFKIIEFVENLEELNRKEIYYISKFDSFNGGYNLTTGGNSCFKISEDVRKKLIDSHKGQKPWNTGKKRKEETIRKVIKGNSNITKIEGLEIYKKYKNKNKTQSDLANEYKMDQGTISKIVNCNHWTTRNLEPVDTEHRKIKEEDEEDIYRKYKKEGKSQQEIADEYGVSRSPIKRIINKMTN